MDTHRYLHTHTLSEMVCGMSAELQVSFQCNHRQGLYKVCSKYSPLPTHMRAHTHTREHTRACTGMHGLSHDHELGPNDYFSLIGQPGSKPLWVKKRATKVLYLSSSYCTLLSCEQSGSRPSSHPVAAPERSWKHQSAPTYA